MCDTHCACFITGTELIIVSMWNIKKTHTHSHMHTYTHAHIHPCTHNTPTYTHAQHTHAHSWICSPNCSWVNVVYCCYRPHRLAGPAGNCLHHLRQVLALQEKTGKAFWESLQFLFLLNRVGRLLRISCCNITWANATEDPGSLIAPLSEQMGLSNQSVRLLYIPKCVCWLWSIKREPIASPPPPHTH